ncbi:phage/plasmid primase, P4 family [Candidatus Amarolinea dominans]|uniref:phage/plasmid primase, P4 family n=1 Tax=Candidatus Amarolinea dominans TaxID=3140696 RepID=UPI003135188E|nr:PriCT-2 domain-containing protein [Anaerolineae bacterium]
MDDCVDDGGNVSPEAWRIIESFNSYTELSPSETGVHILLHGTDRSFQNKNMKGMSQLEVYSSGRYFTVTGKTLVPGSVAEAQDSLDALWMAYAPAYKRAKSNGVHPTPATWGSPDMTLVDDALRHIHPWGIPYGEWVDVLMGIHAEFGAGGLPMAEAWGQGADGEIAKKWSGFKPSGNGTGRVGLGTVFALAKQFGWQRPQAARPAGYQAPVIGEPAPAGAPQIDLILHTDMGNSRRFALRHADRAAYVTGWGWMIWDGKRWESDETGAAARMARTTVKDLWQDAQEAAQEAARAIRDMQAAQDRGDEAALDRAKTHKAESERRSKDLLAWALKSQGSQRLDAMLKLATSEPEIAARVADFDADPWALNVQNGILDLRTGNLRAHDPGARLTKIAGAAYDPGATCPTWLGFLDRVFAHDQTLIDFVQRAAGYSLTADVREQCLFFLYGVGANGKSVFTGALQDVTGSYAMKTRAETLMVKHGDSISEEVAQMPGARFLLAAELEENRRLNESLVKDLTGGDRQRARLLYQRSFEFAPTAKPWLYGNHRPTIRGTDLGIWRRVALIPFGVTIPESERDKNLSGKLRAELPGILAWAVRGCLAWQSAGLGIPDVVRAATADYRHEQDSIGLFLAERCILAPEATVTAGELHGAYLRWAEISHERGISQRAFSQDLATNHGFVTEKDRKPGTGRSYYLGLGLLENAGL